MKTYETIGVTQNYREEIETFSEISEKKNRESETGLSNTKFIKLLVFCCLIKWLPVSQEIRWFWPWNLDSLPKVTLEFFKNLSLNLRYIRRAGACREVELCRPLLFEIVQRKCE